ncbi:MAG: SDR family oxidoreductase, partial [Bacillota bacterium]|nr:SDR family oxidoreductase [Bacillota bacterium]
DKIRINCICPGPTITGMTQDNDGNIVPAFQKGGPVLYQTSIRQIAMPKEIADAALIICSDKARYVAGLTYNVDGGIVI